MAHWSPKPAILSSGPAVLMGSTRDPTSWRPPYCSVPWAQSTDLVGTAGDGLLPFRFWNPREKKKKKTVEEGWTRFSSSPGSQAGVRRATFGAGIATPLRWISGAAEEDLAPTRG